MLKSKLLLIIKIFFGINQFGGVILITTTSYGLLFSYSIIELFNLNGFIKLGIDGLITTIELFGIDYAIMLLGDELDEK